MKQRLFFAILVWCALLWSGITVGAQENTSPLPPPEIGASALPPPGGDAPGRESSSPSISRPSQTRAPIQSSEAGQATGSGGSGSQAQSPAPAVSQPADTALASPQEGIPEKGLFWGVMLGGSFYDYSDDSSDSYYYPSMSGSPSLEMHGRGGFNFDLFLGYDFGLLAVQGEFLFTGDSADAWVTNYSGYNYSGNYEVSGTTIQIPLMAKLDLHWGRLMLQPEAGIYFNFGLGDLDYGYGSIGYENPLFGLMFGGALGFRIGRGYLFTDFRYAMNLGETELSNNWGEYHRSAFMLNVGYQYYIKGKQSPKSSASAFPAQETGRQTPEQGGKEQTQGIR